MRSTIALITTLLLASQALLPAAEKKNVVFIICDDLNDSVHGFGGHPQAHTPNLDRLAKMGVRFTNAHSNAPMCAPSRPSMLSGLYPATTGLYGSEDKFRSLPKLKDAVLFPAHFKNNGYQAYCAASGAKVCHGKDRTPTRYAPIARSSMAKVISS